MPAVREWVTPSSHSKKKKVKFTKPASATEPSHGAAPSSTSVKPALPVPATNPFAVLGEKSNMSSGNPPETQETAVGEPTPHVEDSSPPEQLSVTSTGPPNPSNLDVEEDEVESCDTDIPDSVARALLEALQEKRQGHQLQAAMAPLARVRASQLQQCVANGTEPQEAVIQAALDLIAMGQGPSDPVALADKVSMVSQMPEVQMNATLPAPDSSSSINSTAHAEVTANPLYRAVARDKHQPHSTCLRPDSYGSSRNFF